MKHRIILGPPPTTAGQRRVVIHEYEDYRVFETIPVETELPDPPTSDAAKAHGLRRIKRKHYIPLQHDPLLNQN